jgi:hypothetical protein
LLLRSNAVPVTEWLGSAPTTKFSINLLPCNHSYKTYTRFYPARPWIDKVNLLIFNLNNIILTPVTEWLGSAPTTKFSNNLLPCNHSYKTYTRFYPARPWVDKVNLLIFNLNNIILTKYLYSFTPTRFWWFLKLSCIRCWVLLILEYQRSV